MCLSGERDRGTLLLLAVFREPNRFLRQTSKRTGSRSCGKWAVSQDGPQLCLYAEQQGNLHDAPIAEIASEGQRYPHPNDQALFRIACLSRLGFVGFYQLQTDTHPC